MDVIERLVYRTIYIQIIQICVSNSSSLAIIPFASIPATHQSSLWQNLMGNSLVKPVDKQHLSNDEGRVTEHIWMLEPWWWEYIDAYYSVWKEKIRKLWSVTRWTHYGNLRSKMLIIEAFKTMMVINVELHTCTPNVTSCAFNIMLYCHRMSYYFKIIYYKIKMRAV